jgi:hypothetical protein
MARQIKLQLDPPATLRRDESISFVLKRYIESIYTRLGDGPLMQRAYTLDELTNDSTLAAALWSDGAQYSATILYNNGATLLPAYSDGTNWKLISDNTVIV